MRIATAAWLVAATAVGCTSAAPSRPPAAGRRAAPLVAAGAASASGSAAVAGTEALPLPPAIEETREAACTFTAPHWPREPLEDVAAGRVYLRFAPGGPAFAQLFFGSDVRLALPAALASAGGTVTLDAHGVLVQGHLEAVEMPLYPATVFVMSEVFIPNHELRLLWRSAKPGLIKVAAQPLHRVESYDPELSAERECRDISLGAVVLDDAAIDRALGAKAGTVPLRKPWHWLRAGRLPVSAVPDGDLVATVDVSEPRDDTRTTSPPRVLAVDKGYTRIALSGFGGVLFGWVPSQQLTTSTLEYVDFSHDAFSLIGPPGPHPGHFVGCSHDVPLVAEAGGERHLVGTIRKGTPLEPLGALAGWRQLELPDAGLVVAAGASFWAREADLAGCRP